MKPQRRRKDPTTRHFQAESQRRQRPAQSPPLSSERRENLAERGVCDRMVSVEQRREAHGFRLVAAPHDL
eukprot:238059-Prymnesium_polylepis.1